MAKEKLMVAEKYLSGTWPREKRVDGKDMWRNDAADEGYWGCYIIVANASQLQLTDTLVSFTYRL